VAGIVDRQRTIGVEMEACGDWWQRGQMTEVRDARHAHTWARGARACTISLEMPARSDGEHTMAGARTGWETCRRAKRRQRRRAGSVARAGRERTVRRDSRTGSGNGDTRARSGDSGARRPTTRGKFWQLVGVLYARRLKMD
jgi:hypothetical protein